MSIENNVGSTLGARNALPSIALPPATLGKLEGELYAPGGLLEQSVERPTADQAAQYGNYIVDMLNRGSDKPSILSFAGQKVIGATIGFNDENLSKPRFAGGICALSSFESRKLGVDPPYDIDRYLEEDIEPVTIAQVFEAVGQTEVGETIVTLEDTLWAQKVTRSLRVETWLPVDEDTVARAIASRNQRAFDATQRLRDIILQPGAKPLIPVRDTEVMDNLKSATDEFLLRLGAEVDESDTYRYVYAGMYSGVWKQVLESAGYMSPNETLVIYEPTKHIVSVNSRNWFNGGTPEARFRREMLDKAPYLRRGSLNENVGLITYAEPLFPNGARFRDIMPIDVMPNSRNYQDFDFSRFPKLPPGRYEKDATIYAAFQPDPKFSYYDNEATMKLQENPAFLWGAMYPPTPELALTLYRMLALNVQCRDAVMDATNQALRAGATGDADVPRGAQIGDISRALRSQYSVEMRELSQQVITELQRITTAMFGGVSQ